MLKRAFLSTAGAVLGAATLILSAGSGPAAAGQPAAVPAKMAAPAAAAKPTGLRADVQAMLDRAEQELVALASVMPAEKFSWRPAPGVRSFGEVLLHVAGGNYEIGAAWGVKPPPTVDLAKIEEQGADKGNAVAAMRVSFEEMRKSIAAMPDSELERPIDMFGHHIKVRTALLAAVSHAHEHLGQAIAYARMNGVVPPWTAAEQAQAPKPKR
jgi:uncharacterized damage-inducible protein DinB